MSIEKLKRDLISCGKDFFIDNFYEIKRYTQGELSKEELETIITDKDKWKNISTLGNRVSAIKMIIENNQIEDALKITIASRAKVNVINKAKEIFESELGRKFDENNDQIEKVIDSNLIPEILEELNNEIIQKLCLLEVFNLQKGRNKLIEFENYNDLSRDEIIPLLNRFKESNTTFTKFIDTLNKDSKEFKFLTIAGQLVSYCDVHAANKNTYNEYEDKRTIAKAGVRMNDWIDKLLSYKIEDNDLGKLTPSIRNAITFLKTPENELTMLSENHRKKFSINLLHKVYEPDSIVDDLISFFEPYEIDVENEENRTSVYCSILYSKNVSQLWLNDDNNLVSEEKPVTKNTIDMKIPLNQIFYGPPGTGKTYNISSEAERIINLKSSTNTLDRNKKFDIVLKNIRHKYQDKIYNTRNGNVIYRNFSKAINIWGYFLSAEYDTHNILIHEELKNVPGFVRSGWSQRMKYVTEFDFIEGNWQSDLSGQLGFDLELSDLGVSFKEKLRDFISSNNYTSDDLKNWDREKGIPPVFSDHYCEVLVQVTPLLENITAFKKSLFCALNMCLNNELFRQNNESRNSAEEEIDLVRKYFDINNLTTTDYKWIGWYAENLLDLGLVKKKDGEVNNKFFYELTTQGFQLIDKIIDNWQTEMPSLFGEKLNYEDSVSLGQVEFITFHQSYSYEEFIEGIRPNLADDDLSYSLEPGVFKRISDVARRDQDNNYVIIIDEINRGNISKIFGELITLIEPSKRLFSDNIKEHPKQVTLPYSKKLFGVPKNLYILGTMNTADKSIALLDSALRRRFSFTEMLPKSSVLEKEGVKEIDGIDLVKLFDKMNERIEFLIDKDHTIGHSYFLKIKDNQTVKGLALIFKNEIIPLLTEYFYGEFKKIRLVLGENKDWKSKSESNFFNKKPSQQKSLFGKDEAVEGYDEKIIFELNDDLLGLKEDGGIKGKSEDLIKLFKSVYTKKSN